MCFCRGHLIYCKNHFLKLLIIFYQHYFTLWYLQDLLGALWGIFGSNMKVPSCGLPKICSMKDEQVSEITFPQTFLSLFWKLKFLYTTNIYQVKIVNEVFQIPLKEKLNFHLFFQTLSKYFWHFKFVGAFSANKKVISETFILCFYWHTNKGSSNLPIC